MSELPSSQHIHRSTVLRSTLLSMLLPGVGHALLGNWRWALALGLSFITAVALCAAHIWVGVGFFESYQGSFFFGIISRIAAVCYGFAGLDAYLRSTHQGKAKRRESVLFSLILPGAGHAVAGRWGPAALACSGTLLCGFLARNPSNVVDSIFVGVQLISALSIYSFHVTEDTNANTLPEPIAPHLQVPAAQIALVAVLMSVTAFSGWMLLQRTTDFGRLRVARDDVKISREGGALRVAIPRHSASLVAHGQGWTVDASFGRALLAARHRLGASLLFGVEPIVPFMREDRYLEHVRQRMEEAGYSLERRKKLTIGGRQAHQLRFSRQLKGGVILDRWAVVTIRRRYGYLMMFSCARRNCKRLTPALEKTRDSLRLAPAQG